jgi:hypothetical protein
MRAGESVGLAPAVRRCDDRVASRTSQKDYSLNEMCAATVPE